MRTGRHFVYRCLDSGGQVVYVGCSYDVAARMKQHIKTGIAAETHRLRVTVHPNRAAALVVERAEIARHEPRLNRQIYLMNIADWPDSKLRERMNAEAQSRKYGPYPGDANSATRCLQREYERRAATKEAA